MTTAQPGQEQRMELKPCRACGSDCRIEHFEGQHIQGVMTVYVCADNAKFGGDCPDEYAYLSEEAWNTRPTVDLGEDGELVERLRKVEGAPLCDWARNAITEAADRLILYREARDQVEQVISAWAFAHNIDGALRNDLFKRLRSRSGG